MALPPPSTSSLKSFSPSNTVSDVERRLAALERVFHVAADGSVLIKGATSITIEAGTLIKIRGALSVAVEAGSQLNLKANAGLDLRASAATNIRGSIISLNGGGLPVARVNDPVLNSVIRNGNATVLA